MTIDLSAAIESAANSGKVAETILSDYAGVDTIVIEILNVAAPLIEAAVRERAASELIDLRRTNGAIKGAAGSSMRHHVVQALLEGAARIRNGSHAEDSYPEGWLDGIFVWGGEQQ